MVAWASKASVQGVVAEKVRKVSITARRLKWKADASPEHDFRRCEQREGRGIGDDGPVRSCHGPRCTTEYFYRRVPGVFRVPASASQATLRDVISVFFCMPIPVVKRLKWSSDEVMSSSSSHSKEVQQVFRPDEKGSDQKKRVIATQAKEPYR